MYKQSSQSTGNTLTPPPRYRTPRSTNAMTPQHTGFKTPFEFNLDELQQHRATRPADYDDPYYRWRRGVDNDMHHRPAPPSKAAHVFATCCCGSVWGIVAWIVGIALLVGGFASLLVKTMVQYLYAEDKRKLLT